MFAVSEQEVFSDPSVKQELEKYDSRDFKEAVELPEFLDKHTTADIVEKARDIAFSKYSELVENGLSLEEDLIPMVISCLSYDYILGTYGYNEEVMKAALYQ